jgi:hypothetical protein
VPLRLTWRPLAAGTQPWSGVIGLRASVKSPDTNAIRNFYQDASFAVGGLSGDVSTGYDASVPAPSYLPATILIAVVVLLAAAGAVLYRGARLSGSLSLRAVGGGVPPVSLPRRPRHAFTVTGPGGVNSTITIWRMPFSREMRVKHSSFPADSYTLRPGGRVMVAGIEINHHAGYPDDSRINA